jgi:WD40 repeat protein
MDKPSGFSDSGVQLEVKKGHKDSVNKVIRFSDEDENKFFSASNDKSVRLWDLRVGGSVKKFSENNFGEDLTTMRYSEKKGVLYVACDHKVEKKVELDCWI